MRQEQSAVVSTLRMQCPVTVTSCRGPLKLGVTVSPHRQPRQVDAARCNQREWQRGKDHLRTPLLTSAHLLTSLHQGPSWQLRASAGMGRSGVTAVTGAAAAWDPVRLLKSPGVVTSPWDATCERQVIRGHTSARKGVRTGAASGTRGVPDAGGDEGRGEGDEEEEEEEEEEEVDLSRLTILASAPYLVSRRVRRYFESNPWRRALFGGLALFLGFYVAQTISLTLGTLSLNDVVAAALCVIFTEAVTRYYHTRAKPVLAQALLNVFKMGFMYGLFIDAFKLAS